MTRFYNLQISVGVKSLEDIFLCECTTVAKKFSFIYRKCDENLLYVTYFINYEKSM